MNEGAGYTPYHPRWLRPRISTYWWLERWSYRGFILRELSSLFVAWFVVYLLLLVRAVGQGEAGYQRFLEWSGNPALLVLNGVSLLFVVYHAVTWFKVAPQALVLHLRGKRVGGIWVAAGHYLAWVVVSAALAWLVLGEPWPG